MDFRGEKIESHHVGDYKHIDMFSRTKSHPEIDPTRLENYKRPFKGSQRGEKLSF